MLCNYGKTLAPSTGRWFPRRDQAISVDMVLLPRCLSSIFFLLFQFLDLGSIPSVSLRKVPWNGHMVLLVRGIEE